MKRPEQLLHQQVAAYLRVALPPSVWFSTFPSGGGGKTRGAFLRSMGLKKGVPDLLVVHNGRATWIELKAEKGRVSVDQRRCHVALAGAGCWVNVCRSVAEVQGALECARIPLRAKVTA